MSEIAQTIVYLIVAQIAGLSIMLGICVATVIGLSIWRQRNIHWLKK